MSIPACAAPLALLYQAVITGINDELQPSFGEEAIQSAAGCENLPEATASRIVSLSTGLYDAYRDRHALPDGAASREQFADLIRGGFKTGLNHTQQVLGGERTAEIDRTFELVMLGLRDFAAVEQAQPGGPMPLPDPV